MPPIPFAEFTRVQTYTLDCGLQLFVLPIVGIASIRVSAYVASGAVFEQSHNSGISHFLEHMLFRGNQKIGSSHQLNLLFEEMGEEIEAHTAVDHMYFSYKYHHSFLHRGLRHFCQFLLHPLCQDIAVERRILMAELKEDYNENQTLIDPYTIAAGMLWNSSHAMPVGGTPESIRGIDQALLFDWHRRFFQPENMVLGVCGDFVIEQVCDSVEQAFAERTPSVHSPLAPSSASGQRHRFPRPHLCLDQSPHLRWVDDTDNMFHFSWYFPLVDSDVLCCYRLAQIVDALDEGASSILQQHLREEEGLIYSLSASHESYDNCHVLSVEAQVESEKLTEFCTKISALLNSIRKTGLDAQTYTRLAARQKIHFDFLADIRGSALDLLFEQWLYPQTTLLPHQVFSHWEEIFEQHTLNALLRRILSRSDSMCLIIGPCGGLLRSGQSQAQIERILFAG